jgi:hypothetical protein
VISITKAISPAKKPPLTAGRRVDLAAVHLYILTHEGMHPGRLEPDVTAIAYLGYFFYQQSL